MRDLSIVNPQGSGICLWSVAATCGRRGGFCGGDARQRKFPEAMGVNLLRGGSRTRRNLLTPSFRGERDRLERRFIQQGNLLRCAGDGHRARRDERSIGRSPFSGQTERPSNSYLLGLSPALDENVRGSRCPALGRLRNSRDQGHRSVRLAGAQRRAGISNHSRQDRCDAPPSSRVTGPASRSHR